MCSENQLVKLVKELGGILEKTRSTCVIPTTGIIQVLHKGIHYALNN
jgi:hypothetical protein